MKLRRYQSDALDAIGEARGAYRSALIVMATGLGKTVTFAHGITRFSQKRALVIAHREELIRQAAAKIEAVTGLECEIEMASERADLHMYRRSKVVVASKDTLHERRLQRFNPDDFDFLITDEAHHAVAESYRRIYRHFANCFHLGVTATPDRADEEALGQIFEVVPFVYDILQGIEDGYLVPITAIAADIEGLDLTDIGSTGGDLNQKQLGEKLTEDEKVLAGYADAIIRETKWRKTIVFAVTVKHARALSNFLNGKRADCSRWICGETPREERAQVLADFTARKFQFLVNVGVLTEGFDEPTIECVALARPTESRSLFAQMIGRGTRPLAGVVDGIVDEEHSAEMGTDTGPERRRNAIARSRKPDLLVLDFEGNAGRHKLVHVGDIIIPNKAPEVVERAHHIARKASGTGRPVNALDAMKQAEREIREEKERRRQQSVDAKADYRTRTVNPFDVLDIEAGEDRGWDRNKPITDGQKAMLERNGIETDGISRAQASAIIGKIIERRKTGKCTFKQAKFLKKKGLDANVSFEHARAIMDAFAANGWKRPEVIPSAPVAVAAEPEMSEDIPF